MSLGRLGSVVLVGGQTEDLKRLEAVLNQKLHPQQINRVSAHRWHAELHQALSARAQVAFVLDDGQNPDPVAVLTHLRKQSLNLPVVVLASQAGAHSAEVARAVSLLKAGVYDYLAVDEQAPARFWQRMAEFVPENVSLPESELLKLLAMTEVLNVEAGLRSRQQRLLVLAMDIAHCQRGALFFKTDDGFEVSAINNLDEDLMVLLGSSPKSPLVEVFDQAGPRIYQLPRELPTDEPALWSFREAELERSLLIPIHRSCGGEQRGVLLLDAAPTMSPTMSEIPPLLDYLGPGLWACLSLMDRVHELEAQNRDFDRQVERARSDSSMFVELLKSFVRKDDVTGIADHLCHLVSVLFKPDVVGVYTSSGELGLIELREAHPLPLNKVRAFDRWFYHRLLETFGQSALEKCIRPGTATRIPLDGEEPAEVLEDLDAREEFSEVDWFLLPQRQSIAGAFAYGYLNNPGHNQFQQDLMRALADHVSLMIWRLTVEVDERQQLLKSLLDALPVGVALLDAYGRVVLANNTGEELLKDASTLDAEGRVAELCGEHFYDVTLAVEQTQRAYSIERSVRERVFLVSVASVDLPDHQAVTAAPETTVFQRTRFEPATARGYALALRDMTETSKIREQLIQAEKLSTIGTMVSGVAHELNNPLTGISGYAELLLERKDLPEVVIEDLQRIHKNASRCAHIVTDLLSFARKRQSDEPCDINVPALLSEVIDLLFLQLKDSKVRVKRQFDTDVALVPGDPHRLQQVFVNLINNAWQALVEHAGEDSESAGTIWVRVSDEGPRVKVIIEDDGPGIPPENLGKIFDPFFSTKSTKGTGLGLSICYGIVKDHRGQISVHSPPGKGARFTIELPAVTTFRSATEERPSESSERPVFEDLGLADLADEDAELVVLVVDDAPVYRRVVMDNLSRLGLTVDVAASRDEALATLRFMEYDAIFASLTLRDAKIQSLYEDLKGAEDDHADRTIVLVNRLNGEAYREFQDKHPEMDRVLERPFTEQRLLESLRALLKQRFPERLQALIKDSG